jgi:cell division protein FtsI (penicillin-binding protein 3)
MKSIKFSRSPLLSERLPPWRQRLVLVVLLGAFAALIIRSLYLQGFNSEFLGDKGRARFERVLDISATRGRITDRHGDVLAVTTPVRSIWAIPEDAQLTPAQVRNLAILLEMDVREINRRLAAERDFVYLKRQLPPDLADRVSALKLPGIHQKNEYRRYYPAGEVMAHMLGFTGVEDNGQEGIELAFNSQLAGKPGSRRVIKDRRGNVVEDVESIHPPLEGKDIVLALDSKLQYLAYSHLKRSLEENRAKAGGVVILDARSGEILALANLPTYNPNNRVKLVGAQLRNRALTDTFEPGSTLKPFTAALALESGQGALRHAGPDRTRQTDPRYRDDPRCPSPWNTDRGAGDPEVVQRRCRQAGAVDDPGTDVDHVRWCRLRYAAEAGLPRRSRRPPAAAKTWKPIEQATMAYGHGISVTLIQLARAYSRLLPATATWCRSRWSRIDTPPLNGKQVVISARDGARESAPCWRSAVHARRHRAEAPRFMGYRVAGKTGTAHKLEGGAYAANKYVASFVGFAPASRPAPDRSRDGGRAVQRQVLRRPDVAAPVFAQVMGGSLRSLGVAPDAPAKPIVMTSAEPVREEM